jgi:hypothetical protein
LTSQETVVSGTKDFAVEDVVSVYSGSLLTDPDSTEHDYPIEPVYKVIDWVLDTAISTIGIVVVQPDVAAELERQFPWLSEVAIPEFSQGLDGLTSDELSARFGYRNERGIIEQRIREFNEHLRTTYGARLQVARKAGPAYETNPLKDIADYDAKNGTDVMGKTVIVAVDDAPPPADATHFQPEPGTTPAERGVCIEPPFGCGQPVEETNQQLTGAVTNDEWTIYHRVGVCPSCQPKLTEAAQQRILRAGPGFIQVNEADLVNPEG